MLKYKKSWDERITLTYVQLNPHNHESLNNCIKEDLLLK